jgi:hypothetical protein
MDYEKKCQDFGNFNSNPKITEKRCGKCPLTFKCFWKFLKTAKLSKLLKTLAKFYRLPYENVLVNTTNQKFIELTIEDMVALSSIPKLDLDWAFSQIILLDEEY